MSCKLIAHRGNTVGVKDDRENNPTYIEYALEMGYNVEVDIWKLGDMFWLGHDMAQWPLNNDICNRLFQNQSIWWHAKNKDALEDLVNRENINVFAHENDKFAFTSKGYIWTCNQQIVGPKVVHMLVDVDQEKLRTSALQRTNLAGICCDNFNFLLEIDGFMF